MIQYTNIYLWCSTFISILLNFRTLFQPFNRLQITGHATNTRVYCVLKNRLCEDEDSVWRIVWIDNLFNMLISSQPTVFKGVISTSNPYEGGGVVPPLDSLFAHLWIQCKTKVYILSLNSKRILFGLVHFHRFLNQYSGIQKSQKTLICTHFFESATAIVSLRWTNFYVIFFSIANFKTAMYFLWDF